MKRFLRYVARKCVDYPLAVLYALMLASVLALLLNLTPVPAECITDSQCLALCPPGDHDCDGGP